MNFIPEQELVISQLERGTVVTKFFFRKRAERRTLAVRRETRQVIWQRANNNGGGGAGSGGGSGGGSVGSNSLRTLCEGMVDIREIKLIRQGKNSKDFDKWPDDAKRQDQAKCFVIFYGQEFRLRTLSIAALSEKEADLWLKGLNFLIADTYKTPYPLQLERWLRKEFYGMENTKGNITLKELKTFLPKVNCKMSTSKLREVFQKVDTRKLGEIGFDDYSTLFHDLLVYDRSPFDDYLGTYSMNKEVISLEEFCSFLEVEQKEKKGDVGLMIKDYLQDPLRDVKQPHLTVPEV